MKQARAGRVIPLAPGWRWGSGEPGCAGRLQDLVSVPFASGLGFPSCTIGRLWQVHKRMALVTPGAGPACGSFVRSTGDSRAAAQEMLGPLAPEIPGAFQVTESHQQVLCAICDRRTLLACCWQEGESSWGAPWGRWTLLLKSTQLGNRFAVCQKPGSYCLRGPSGNPALSI